MYLRTTSRRNADGSTVRYLALAHNERVQGQSRAKILLNLGREDELDVAGLRRWVSSVCRFLGDADPYAGDTGSATGGASGMPGQGLTVWSSRSLSGVWLLDGLWRQLGVETALRQVLGTPRFSTGLSDAPGRERRWCPAAIQYETQRLHLCR
jgi:hypothetical protein